MTATTTTTTTKASRINGIDVQALRSTIEDVTRNPAVAQTRFAVTTDWQGGTVSRTRINGYELAGKWIERHAEFTCDEPRELCGTDTRPNPQEYLMGALNACMTVGYVAGAALLGVTLESLRIETEGDIDLRGFLGVRKDVPAGYPELRYTVHIKGDGTPEQMRQIHDIVQATSPNRYNLAQPIRMVSKLIVE